MLSFEMVCEWSRGTMVYHARGTRTRLRIDDDALGGPRWPSRIMHMSRREMGWLL
jgi:hypothetical protein